jgi:hypothetical protein
MNGVLEFIGVRKMLVMANSPSPLLLESVESYSGSSLRRFSFAQLTDDHSLDRSRRFHLAIWSVT